MLLMLNTPQASMQFSQLWVIIAVWSRLLMLLPQYFLNLAGALGERTCVEYSSDEPLGAPLPSSGLQPVVGSAGADELAVLVVEGQLVELDFLSEAKESACDRHCERLSLQCFTDSDPPTPPPMAAAIITTIRASSSQNDDGTSPQMRRCGLSTYSGTAVCGGGGSARYFGSSGLRACKSSGRPCAPRVYMPSGNVRDHPEYTNPNKETEAARPKHIRQTTYQAIRICECRAAMTTR